MIVNFQYKSLFINVTVPARVTDFLDTLKCENVVCDYRNGKSYCQFHVSVGC